MLRHSSRKRVLTVLSSDNPSTGTRVAVVTGAGRGIGQVIATRLASAGYDVGITARSADQLAITTDLIEQTGRRAIATPGDVTDPIDVARVIDTVTDQLGPVDLLVNNAGYLGRYGPFVESQTDDWWRVVETNVQGPVLYTRALLPAMLRRGRGHIININSLQGSHALGTSVAYAVSKAALMRFTDALAEEISGSGVAVMDLSPGLVRTVMTDDRPDLDSIPDSEWTPPEVAAQKVVDLVSGRYDKLHGRFIHVLDDLDDLLSRVAAYPDGRVLRLTPAGADDPILD
ncbi:SDR family NAD(P)-dependent oxidoreductase [Micromonospora sp. SL1-18]|uniref:SDR family NAD(P)-dependent oxidoreductase n=1 Tax=Micromonospora sp. SL1-18 TaxID=3399128 RepID=UPI003A4DEBBB